MNIVTLVFFRAAQGDLHENVRATQRQLLRHGHNCTVVCRGGDFADELQAMGIQVVTTDFSDQENARTLTMLDEINNENPFSVIHTHPFASRKLAQAIAKKWQIPLVTTIHGKYTDKLEENYEDFSAVFTVSQGISQYLIESVGQQISSKLMTFPNGVDLELFFPKRQAKKRSSLATITLVSRFDKDKQFIMDTFLEAVNELSEEVERNGGGERFKVMLVGQGTEQDDFINSLKQSLSDNGVEHKGWLSGSLLEAAYNESDIIVAPGRCALESMACAKPTIAIGSKGYVGIVDENSWQQGVFSNFGGVGKQYGDYPDSAMAKDMRVLLENSERRNTLGQLGRKLVELMFDETAINNRLVAAYELLSLYKNISPKPDQHKKLASNVYSFIQPYLPSARIEQNRILGNADFCKSLSEFSSKEPALACVWDLHHLNAEESRQVIADSVTYLPENGVFILISDDINNSQELISQYSSYLSVEVFSTKNKVIVARKTRG